MFNLERNKHRRMKLALLVLIGFVLNGSLAESNECMIYSDQHRQYLYRAVAPFSFNNRIYTWSPQAWTFKSAYNSDIEYTDRDPKGLWYFEPVASQAAPNTFLIRNKHYNEYLYASTQRAVLSYFTVKERYVFSSKEIKPSLGKEAYMWKLERHENGRFGVRYIIRNVKYSEETLASSVTENLMTGINPKISSRNEAYTWAAPIVQYWRLRCKDNVEPSIN